MTFISFLPQSWQSWALLLACILAIGFPIISKIKDWRKNKKNTNNTKTALTEGMMPIPLSVQKATRKHASKVVILAIGFVIGWLWRDHQFNVPVFAYSDVLVVSRHDDRNFTLQPARMAPVEATTCTPVDWEDGQKMRILIYHQQQGCKDVVAGGRYEFYNKDGKRVNYQQGE